MTASGPAVPALAFEEVRTTFARRGRRVVALDRVSLAVEAGTVTAIIGTNGAGKSTLLRVAAGLVLHDEGQVSVLGSTMPEHAAQVAPALGCVLDGVGVLPGLRGFDNVHACAVRRGLGARGATDAIESCGLTQAEAMRPVRTYSLGMRQRLLLAMALVGGPRLLLLDEPTNGLDPSGMAWLHALVRELVERHGTTVVISSHHLLELEQLSTHVVAMASGRVTHHATVADHLANARVAHRLRTTAAPQEALGLLCREVPAALPRREGDDLIADLSAEELANLSVQLAAHQIGIVHLAPAGGVLGDLLGQGRD